MRKTLTGTIRLKAVVPCPKSEKWQGHTIAMKFDREAQWKLLHATLDSIRGNSESMTVTAMRSEKTLRATVTTP